MNTVQPDRDALFYPDPLEPGQRVHILSIVGNDVLVDFPGTTDNPVIVSLNLLKPLPEPDNGILPSPLEGQSAGVLPVEGPGVRGDFGDGQRVTYTPATPPIRALPATVTTVHDNGKVTIRIDDTEDIPSEYRGGTRTVRASRCAPLTESVDPAIVSGADNSPAETAPEAIEPFGEDAVAWYEDYARAAEEWLPRFVDPDHAAITGFCRDCESQYDYLVDPLDLNPRDVDLVYWAAFSQPCPVCRIIRAAQVTTTEPAIDTSDDPTELLPAVVDLPGIPEERRDVPVPDVLTYTAADPFNLASLSDLALNSPLPSEGEATEVADFSRGVRGDLITDLRALVAHWQRAAELESARADRLQDKIDDYLTQHIELLKRIPVAPGACLDNADLDRLDFLTVKHLDRSLTDAVKLLGFVNFDDFTNHYHSFSEAMKGIYQRILDGGLPVVIHEGSTDTASNDKLFFQVSFGFGNVAFWNGDIHIFSQTPHQFVLDEWRHTGYSVEFHPPIRAILGRDGKHYPKIKTLLED